MTLSNPAITGGSTREKYLLLLEKYKALKLKCTSAEIELKNKDELLKELMAKSDVKKGNSMLFHSLIFQLKRQLNIYKDIAAQKQDFIHLIAGEFMEVLTRLEKSIAVDDDQNSTKSVIGNKSKITSTKSKESIVAKSREKNEDLTKKSDAVNRAIELKLIQKLKSVISHLTRGIKDPFQEKHHDLIFTSEFLSNTIKVEDTVTMKVDHLNLRHVARLELQLESLYGKLSSLQLSLKNSMEPNISPLFVDQIQRIFDASIRELENCMQSLAELSFLIPAPPLPPLRSSRSGKSLESIDSGLNVDCRELLKDIPSLSASSLQLICDRLNPILQTHHQKSSKASTDAQNLQNELLFHRKLYTKYTSTISKLVQDFASERKLMKTEMEVVKTDLKTLLTKLKDLEWKEDQVAIFLEGCEKDLDKLCRGLNSLIQSLD